MNQASSVSRIDLTSHELTTNEALRCLIGELDIEVPVPSAKVCNNLDEYLYKSTANARKTPIDDSKSGCQNRRRHSRDSFHSQEPFAVPLVRNFEKILKKGNLDSSQLDSTDAELTVSRPKRAKPDVFSRSEADGSTLGPLSLLKGKKGKVVKVLIRRRRKVPYISRTIEYKGTLVLFDKHMNLYLNDALESFTYTQEGRILKRARFRLGVIIRGDNVIVVS